MINAGNEIAHLPYHLGRGPRDLRRHRLRLLGLDQLRARGGRPAEGDRDLRAADVLRAPGPGKWITIYATQGHTFMYVAGLRFDTVALAQTGSRWSNRSATEGGGFVARHPPSVSYAPPAPARR